MQNVATLKPAESFRVATAHHFRYSPKSVSLMSPFLR